MQLAKQIGPSTHPFGAKARQNDLVVGAIRPGDGAKSFRIGAKNTETEVERLLNWMKKLQP